MRQRILRIPPVLRIKTPFSGWRASASVKPQRLWRHGLLRKLHELGRCFDLDHDTEGFACGLWYGVPLQPYFYKLQEN